MATYIRCKLVNKLNSFHRLQDSKREGAITTTHSKFRRAAKRRADCNTPSAHLRLLKVLLT